MKKIAILATLVFASTINAVLISDSNPEANKKLEQEIKMVREIFEETSNEIGKGIGINLYDNTTSDEDPIGDIVKETFRVLLVEPIIAIFGASQDWKDALAPAGSSNTEAPGKGLFKIALATLKEMAEQQILPETWPNEN